jgi:hypothetical protein
MSCNISQYSKEIGRPNMKGKRSVTLLLWAPTILDPVVSVMYPPGLPQTVSNVRAQFVFKGEKGFAGPTALAILRMIPRSVWDSHSPAASWKWCNHSWHIVHCLRVIKEYTIPNQAVKWLNFLAIGSCTKFLRSVE